jgi:uncharacterized protein
MMLWELDEMSGFDTAWVRLQDDGLRAEGQQSGLVPAPYWVRYRLTTGERFVTARMEVKSRWQGGGASVALARGEDGRWTVDGEPRADLDDALDVDLGACPLTNTMPIRRHGLHVAQGEHDFVMAFIEVPRLSVVPSRQHYTHLRLLEGGGGAVVEYRSGSFRSELTVDADGFVVNYPQLGRRVEPGPVPADIRRSGPGSARPS